MGFRKRVLITGGAGFIGSRLAVRLADEGHNVRILDNLHPQVHPTGVVPAEVESWFIRGDITDLAAVKEALDFRPQCIVHLAAETGTGQSLEFPTRHASVNVLGTSVLLEELYRARLTDLRVILASSRAVYGEGRWATPGGAVVHPPARSLENLTNARWTPMWEGRELREPLPHDARSTEPRPSNVYAATKLAQEHLLRTWSAGVGADYGILRLQNVYGAGQSVSNSYTGVLTYFARQATLGEPLEVYEGGGIIRDFVHVSDVVSALAAAIMLEGGLSIDAVDIGSGTGVSLLAVATEIARIAGTESPRVTDNYRPGDVRAAWADIAQARSSLNWLPKVALTEGLHELVRYVRETP